MIRRSPEDILRDLEKKGFKPSGRVTLSGTSAWWDEDYARLVAVKGRVTHSEPDKASLRHTRPASPEKRQ